MTWTSPQLMGWAVAFVVAAWLLPKRLQTWAVIAVSALFLGTAAPLSAMLLAALGTLGYLGCKHAQKTGGLALLAGGLVVAVLLSSKWGVHLGDGMPESWIPLGISFYSLRIIHTLVEARTGGEHARSAKEYAAYLFFLPTLVAGPINRIGPLCRDLRRRRWDSALFALGLERILYGYVKIVVLGNWFAGKRLPMIVHAVGEWNSGAGAYADCLRYGANLYFQFAGYSDVAIGLALVAGFRVAENFNWPFLAASINDFWHRWNMTLSSWCRDYVFMPVAALTRIPVLGVISGMLILGLWHELSWRYCLWGVYHGVGIATWQAFRKHFGPWESQCHPRVRRAGVLAAWLLTQNFVLLSFAITKSSSLAEAWQGLLTILTLGQFGHV